MERENGGQRKIASASGIPTTMLSSESEHDLHRRHPAVLTEEAPHSP